jgi:(p)ppGpp synthase/HD superfamily hydrolase
MNSREKLTGWVQAQHAGQLIRKTNEPYFNHLLVVAEMTAPKFKFGYETGLCHDLLEKTAITLPEFRLALRNFGYEQPDDDQIALMVLESTNVYAKLLTRD